MMMKPSFSEFKQMSREGNLIPVYEEFLADTETPVSAYLKLREDSCSYLLESADSGNRWGRYSFIGIRPFLKVLSRDNGVEISKIDSSEVVKGIENPLLVLRELLKRYNPVKADGLPSFQGGLVGYVNYDLIRKWERLPGISALDGDIPESIFMAPRIIVIFDHLSHEVKVVSFAIIEEGDDLSEIYNKACLEVEDEGTGIQEDHIEEIFEPGVGFTPSGFGLGLSLCRAIVRMHGGRIGTQSQPGRTVFRGVEPQRGRVPRRVPARESRQGRPGRHPAGHAEPGARGGGGDGLRSAGGRTTPRSSRRRTAVSLGGDLPPHAVPAAGRRFLSGVTCHTSQFPPPGGGFSRG